jgi:Gnt-I system high-affinity gluconate transporter/Gnt-II system L-idonate transporter
MGSIALIIVSGAILGKLIEESGAAHTVSYGLTRLFGENRVQLSIVVTGFLVGLPMFYNAGFLVLTPLVYALSSTSGLALLYLGIPLSASLSVTHGFLPPHPAPIPPPSRPCSGPTSTRRCSTGFFSPCRRSCSGARCWRDSSGT